MKLRPYQQRAIDQLYDWFRDGNKGHPCIVMPTGSGKSHVIAALCKDALTSWPETKILMLTHIKELIEQNAEKMLQHWPDAPLGIYSASCRKRQLGEPITFAGIQSVRSKARQIGHIDLILIDECFVAGTKISTPTGQKDIDLMRCGDTVYNAHGVGSVIAVSAKPSQDIYKLEFSDGTFIECTGNHPFFTAQGWKQARELENGTYFFSIEGLRLLWSSVSSLDQKRQGDKQDHFGLSRADLDQARLLLNILCEEIEKPNEQSSGSLENESETERDKAQAYQAWRQRAVVALGTASITARIGGGMGGGIGNTNQDGESWGLLSDLLQSGLGKSVNEAGNRIRRREPSQLGKKGSGFEENRLSCFPRLERISRVQPAGARTVFNIQVSGHPSYFANGKLVHNCHLINHKEEGSYRTLLSDLEQINPGIRVVGLTATPYRLGHGLITDKPAIFDAILEPVSIEELIYGKYLAPLRSKVTESKLCTDGVHKRGGEFIESELQDAVDTEEQNRKIAQEICRYAEDRKSWLIFCSGVQHARHMAEQLIALGVDAEYITGKTPKHVRERIIADFKAKKIRALTNANVLTTGFDAPDVDLIAMLRPTMSTGLYVQMAGRGMRLKSHTDHCLVLDFAGNVSRHGPITAVQLPEKNKEGGTAPVKFCPQCGEILHASVRMCTSCGYEFQTPEQKAQDLVLRHDDIMGLDGRSEMEVESWIWQRVISRTSGMPMMKCTYYGRGLMDPIVREYFCIWHSGYAGSRALREMCEIVDGIPAVDLIEDHCNQQPHPKSITYKREGKFFKVIGRKF